MSIWLVFNTVGRAAGQTVATDTSDVAIADQSKVGVVRGGPTHLKWTSDSATAARRIAYVNKAGGLAANFCCIVDATPHTSSNVKIVEFTAYPGTESNIDSRTLDSAELMGVDRSYWVYKFSSVYSSKQAFAVEFGGTSYRKTARQIYFGEGLEFSEVPAASVVTVQPISIHEPPTLLNGQPYHLYGIATLSVEGVTRDQLQTYEQLKKNHPEPFFVYDSSGTLTVGKVIEHKAWHAIILEDTISPVPGRSDDFILSWQFGILRSW